MASLSECLNKDSNNKNENKRMRQFSVIMLLVLLSACISPKVTYKPIVRTDYGAFKTVSYKVHDLPSTDYGSAEASYGRETLDLFRALLATRLTALGYDVVDERADLSIDIAVKAVKPGNLAARLLVGFGAGRAVLLFDATFSGANGKMLGSFQGGRSHTGMELTEGFSTREMIRTIAATAAVKQVETFLRNSGRFPEQAARAIEPDR